MQKQNRLSKNWQFQSIITSNRKVETKYIIGYYANNALGHMRIGISVSKKFAGSVQRNLQKRQTRAAIDTIQTKATFLDKGAFDLILILRRPYLEANFERKVSAIEEVLTKLKGKE